MYVMEKSRNRIWTETSAMQTIEKQIDGGCFMKLEKRNRITFGLGTIGRDMIYTLESIYLITFFTEVRQLSDAMLAAVGGVLTFMRIFDALNDPLMGVVVDNTSTRFGKYKPWLVTGVLGAAAAIMFMFSDIGLTGTPYVVMIAFFYLLWDLFYGVNDIAYWSMLPSLSVDQKQREKDGAFARICANIGMYIVVVGIVPITGMMTKMIGNEERAWWYFALAVCILMVGFQLITVFGVKENHIFKQEESTSLRDMVRVLLQNDQLLFTAIGMILFMIGYSTTTSFGLYFIITI
jgi:melibiose permease/lactose/raffinose/galactose permease